MALRKHNKVFTVFSFLRLSSADIRWYQWTYPTALFLVVVVGFHWLGSVWLVYDTDKLVADLNSLMGILVGFYIAALAAVSSFTNENLAGKLLDIGVRPGSRLRIIRKGPFGGSWYVKIDRHCMALRKQELACIMIK
jgi:Fe2+ transport system protein FeoA